MITSFKRVRKILANNFSVTGHICSIKNNEHVEFESSLERDFIYLLEYNLEVKRYYEQPIKIHYLDENIEKYYVPDFYVEYWDGTKELVEVKYVQELEEKNSELSIKFKAAELFCKDNNISFKIYSEHLIRTPLGWNAKFLNYYRYPKFDLNLDEATMIRNRLKKLNESTPAIIIKDMANDESKQAELLYLLWYLIANYSITFDNDKKLSMNTLIWVKKNG
ncbi:heteromeric transposase endonuclease subunit TnsA [Flavobacterium sp. ZT3R18]|uniref:TnsA endonuclease N-terminal domain-containing protein n=1 Tax=Flavobacterium sp. ZT3R18 TaxID=2594429 RepID=UPI00117B55DC|nr:TnsA endonuclease N-terminal domain-containing protein [Flavobacterium sp. ZT3R18]TRX34988.1 heteromeric transposase endonuclease subunit TnsA [Flavobacterium sp. ZT3R18]